MLHREPLRRLRNKCLCSTIGLNFGGPSLGGILGLSPGTLPGWRLRGSEHETPTRGRAPKHYEQTSLAFEYLIPRVIPTETKFHRDKV